MHSVSEHIWTVNGENVKCQIAKSTFPRNPSPRMLSLERLRIAREMRGLDQSALAEKSGLPPLLDLAFRGRLP